MLEAVIIWMLVSVPVGCMVGAWIAEHTPWALDRKDKDSDITQLMAVTLAMHGFIEYGQRLKPEVWGLLL